MMTPARHAASGRTVRVSVLLSGLIVAVLAAWGGWQRRWISDDGLIVLRTVRNLLAGNGPVFNIGERVEANTSVAWQYLIYLGAKLTGAALESVALWLALLATVVAMCFATAGTARLYRSYFLLPLGPIIYLALPPARDFATSGLEWGLSLAYLALLWWALTRWADTASTTRLLDAPTVILAFLCGLSWLIRPELILYGGMAGLLLLVADRRLKRLAAIMGIALPLPLAYEIFRMGYYGLLVPHTAVAKSATGAAWREGLAYVVDFSRPYILPLAVLLALLAGVAAWRLVRVAGRQRAVIVLMVACAGLHTLYVVRVGGDFMHGRMLLLPLFAALLPVAVVPVVLRGWGLFIAGAWTLSMGWAFTAVWGGSGWTMPTDSSQLSVVDEREFWTLATRREAGDPPLSAADFLAAESMTNFPEAVAAAQRNDDALITQIIYEDGSFSWTTIPRGSANGGLADSPPTLYLLNLGMTSMNAPLEVRVLDTVGLATPLAARQPRIIDGRIGHDKSLPVVWSYADSAADLSVLPDPEESTRARAALQTPEYVELFDSYRAPLTPVRFWHNIGFALTTGRTLELAADPAAVDLSDRDPQARISWAG